MASSVFGADMASHRSPPHDRRRSAPRPPPTSSPTLSASTSTDDLADAQRLDLRRRPRRRPAPRPPPTTRRRRRDRATPLSSSPTPADPLDSLPTHAISVKLRDYAEAVVTSRTLEGKLVPPPAPR